MAGQMRCCGIRGPAVLVAALTSLVAASVEAAEAGDDQVLGCAVRILTRTVGDEDQVVDSVVGTGAFVADGNGKHCVVTAYHVVRGHENVRFAGPSGGASVDPVAKKWVEPLCLPYPELDLCVFHLTDDGLRELRAAPFSRTPVGIRNGSPAVGSRLLAVGNPKVLLFRKKTGGGGNELTHESFPVNVAASATLAAVASALKLLGPNAVDSVAHDTPLLHLNGIGITHGFSGGPLIVEEGTNVPPQLVGILIGGDPDLGTVTWGVAAAAVREALAGTSLVRRTLPSTHWPKPAFQAGLFELPQAVEVNFPLLFPEAGFEVTDPLVVGKAWSMKTKVNVSANGRIDATTELSTAETVKQILGQNVFEGFKGKVVVFFCDARGNVLAHVESPVYGVPVGLPLSDGDEVARREVWNRDGVLGSDLLAHLRRVKIIHLHAPDDEAWRKALENLLKNARVEDGAVEGALRDLESSFIVPD